MKNLKKNSGVTLIALVITLVVLLIIVGISIVNLVGSNGILTKSLDSAEFSGRQKQLEAMRYAVIEVEKSNGGGITEAQFFEIVDRYGVVDVRDRDTGNVTTTEGSYKIALIEVYDGPFMDMEIIKPDDEHEYDETDAFYARLYQNQGKTLVLSDTQEFRLAEFGLESFVGDTSYISYDKMRNPDGTYPWKGANIENVKVAGYLRPTDLSHFFEDCRDIQTIDFTNLDTSKLTDISYMFKGHVNPQQLTLINFDTSHVKNMSHMFEGSDNLQCDLSQFDTSSCTNMSYMFYNCQNSTKLDFSKLTSNACTDFSHMFEGCTNREFNLASLNTINGTTMEAMFKNCTNSSSIIFGSGFDTRNVSTMKEMFYGNRTIQQLDLTTFNTKYLISMESMFEGCSSLRNVIFGTNFKASSVRTMKNLFKDNSGLENINLATFETNDLRSMESMFQGDMNLKNVTFGSKFYTSKVTTMKSLFQGCQSLRASYGTENGNNKFMDLSSFDWTTVTDLSYMFNGCSSLNVLIQPEKFTLKNKNTTNMMDSSAAIKWIQTRPADE